MEMLRKLKFYDHHKVKEFIIIDPYNNDFIVYAKDEEEDELQQIELKDAKWKSSLMNITIAREEKDIKFYFPDGKPFRSPEEWNQMFGKESVANAILEKEKEQERLAKEKALEEVARLKEALEQLSS